MDLLSTIRKQGSRGGVNFSWDEVATSAHRENYLGHSLKAPVGRWAQGRDLTWYAKADAKDTDLNETEDERKARERREEIRRIKEAEEDAIAQALGLPPKQRNTTGANAIEVPERKATATNDDDEMTRAARFLRREEKEKIERRGHSDRNHRDSERPERHRRRHRSRSHERDSDRKHHRDRSSERHGRRDRSGDRRHRRDRCGPAARQRSRSRDNGGRRHERRDKPEFERPRSRSKEQDRQKDRHRERAGARSHNRSRSPPRRRSQSPE